MIAPIRIELLLQISVATLTALGTLLLGMGERQIGLPLIAIVVSASSVFFTDVSGWLRLNPRVANIAGSTAVVIFVWDFLQRFGEETQLLAVANLLIYLQFVLLYQRKSESTYWLLALLSLLQVAVATALNFDLIFGVLLFVYLICGLTALSLFFLHREVTNFERGIGDLSLSVPDIRSPSRRWPLSTGKSSVQTLGRHSKPSEVLGWRFVKQLTALTVSTFGLALLCFFAVPRMGQNTWRAPTQSGRHVVGASNEVTLDSFGPIIENPEVVMRIELYKGDTDQDYALKETPLFRGPVLTRYSRNTWKQAIDVNLLMYPPDPPRAKENLVRQVIRMCPLNTDSIYCVAPIEGVRDGELKHLHFDSDTDQLTRSQSGRDQTIEIYSSGFVDGRQALYIPNQQNWYNLQEMLDYSEVDLPRLVPLAKALVAETPEQETLIRARKLAGHLHDSGLYQYDRVAPRRNPKIDPIEDFLFEHQQGHCEYFASALALMLRAIGIPSRVVLGFNGGEYNSVGNYYQVRQLHAHAWVEAYLAPNQLPAQLQGRARWKYGAWLTLDPTPGVSGAVSRIGVTAGAPSFRQIADYARYLWSSYIMSLDSDRQVRTIYEPIGKWCQRRFSELLAACRRLVDQMMHPFGIDDPRIAAWVAVLSMAALATAIVLGIRRRFEMLRQLGSALGLKGRPVASPPQTVVQFHRRLERLLARFDLSRADGLTQYEFAKQAAAHLSACGLPAQVTLAPLRVTDAFYQVRFGRRQLDKAQLDAVEQALGMLDEASRARKRRSSPLGGISSSKS